MFLSRAGASTSVKDGLGVTVFERASTERMRSVLRCPPDPQSIAVVSLGHGTAVIQWKMVPSKPPLESFEVKENVSGQVWSASLREVQRFCDAKGGIETIIFRSPPGSVWSGEKHTFFVRAVNVDGIVGRWCMARCSVYADHWLSEWNSEEKESEIRERAEEKKNTIGYLNVKLGQVNFGKVPRSEWKRVVWDLQREGCYINSVHLSWLSRPKSCLGKEAAVPRIS